MNRREQIDWEHPLQKLDVIQAYEQCRQIAKREAKNFYYAFLALPTAKRNAMCAMYAFMRRADDIADEETMPMAERRTLMTRWREGFHTGHGVSGQDSSVFLAVWDSQRRFDIADELLEELVAGTAMDLAETLPTGVVRVAGEAVGEGKNPRLRSETLGTQVSPQVEGATQDAARGLDCYETVEALDRYCYLVASVVGLVTIRIFGFTDARANEYAIALGKAFQYTNILRDVREDAERGRVYLPLEVLEAHGADVGDVTFSVASGHVSEGLKAAMAELGQRAGRFYAVGEALVPLLDADSRGAMRVLIAIYHELLVKLEAARFEVMGERVRVSTGRKLLLLAKGMASGAVGRFA